MTKVLIMGDTAPTATNFELFSAGNIEEIIGDELADLFRKVDYRIINLETPLTDENTPIAKWGVNLSAPTSTMQGIKALNIDYAGLANNHIMDQGTTGLYSTIHLLQENDIAFSNVGDNLLAATKGKIIEIKGIKLGIYACVEHEYSCACENAAGANPFEALDTYNHINELKKRCDYLLVLYHGGKEHYRYPTPYLQKCCRRFIDSGADLVVCQHSHCVGCEEEYLNGTIVYGQGNFIFDYLQDDCWQNGLIIEWDISKENKHVSYIPIQRNANKVIKADAYETERILNAFRARSIKIKDKKFLNKSFDMLCKECFGLYMRGIKKGTSLQTENYIKCETHREILLRGISLEQERKNRIIQMLFTKKIIIWGIGNNGCMIYNRLKTHNIDIYAFCDNDETKWGSTKYEIEVISPENLLKQKDEECLIVVATIHENEIEEQLLQMGFHEYYLLSDLKGGFLDV